jgi:hypothetical protein
MAYVFAPSRNLARGSAKSRLEYLKERKDQIYENLRDLNFENRAGKYPEAEFEVQRNAIETEAAGVLAEIEALEKN